MNSKPKTSLVNILILILDLLPGLYHAITLKFWPLRVFMTAQWFVFLYLNLYPNARPSEILFTWIGPFPRPNELASSYHFRVARCSIGVCFLFITISILGFFAMCDPLTVPQVKPVPMAFFMFACPLFSGMGLLSCLQSLFRGLRLRLGRRDFILNHWDEQSEAHEKSDLTDRSDRSDPSVLLSTGKK